MLEKYFRTLSFFGLVYFFIGSTKVSCQDNFSISNIKIERQKIKSINKYASVKFFVNNQKQEIESCILKSDSSIASSCDLNKGQPSILASFKTAGKHYFGFGEQFSHLDFKNKKPYIFTEEQGIGRGDKPLSKFTRLFGVCGDEFSSYAPMNFFFTDRNEAFIFTGSPYIRYDFTKPNSFSVESWSKELKIKYINAANPKEILYKTTELTGRMPMLPDWAFGTWLGLQGGEKKVEEIINQALLQNNPVSAVWIQDWVGRRKTRFGSQLWWTWTADTIAYPNFPEFCKRMRKQNIRVLGYINSFIASEGKLFEEAKSKGYLVRNKKGEDYEIKTAGFPAFLIDLTNPNAFQWLKNVIHHNLIDQGLSGWMADYGEWLPLDAKLYSGINALDYHNQYAVDWAKLNREAIHEAGRDSDIVFFTRSGALGSAKYSTLFWSGDQLVDWGENDGLPSAICALITSGLSGITLNHSDIGGYTTVDNIFLKVKRDEELLKRWIEFATFTPVFRTHEGLIPESNIQIYSNDSIMKFFSRFGKIHFALKDYFKELNKEATEKGIPIVRALLLEFPDDTITYPIKDEFLLGEDLLVAPVVIKGAKSREVYFPAGEWVNVWTNETIQGKRTKSINSEIGFPSVFIKKNGRWYDQLINIFRKFSST